MKRDIQTLHTPITAQDGAGVKLKRFFPVTGLDNIDPFMLLDHFGSDNPDDFIAGFPMHPHRGIETVTYMLEGSVRHRDSTGHSGIIRAGDVQWMSAGRGIMHEEMPEVAEGRLDGFQLWVNLPAKDKMQPAQYQDYPAADIPRIEYQGHEIRLISGELLGHQGVVDPLSKQPTYADIRLNPGQLSLTLPAVHSAFIYVFQGELELLNEADEARSVTAPELAVLTRGEQILLQTRTRARLLLVTGQANNEPIARSGPFVMNTKEEIAQTWREIRHGNFPPSP